MTPRNQNRLDFPECARVVDLLQQTFGKVKVIWAIENGKEIGTRPEPGAAWPVNAVYSAPRISR